MDELQLIQSKIYEIRGQKVMLDFDLAEMYEVETRALNQAVKRNIERFPEDFMYQLAKDEWQNMSSQFVMTSRNKRPKTAIPLAFTEHGVKCAQKQYSYPSKCFNRSCLRRHPSTDSQSTGRQSGGTGETDKGTPSLHGRSFSICFSSSPTLSTGGLAISWRMATKARMILILICIAAFEFKTLLSMATPNSVKA